MRLPFAPSPAPTPEPTASNGKSTRSRRKPTAPLRPLGAVAAALTLTAGCGLFGSDDSGGDPPGEEGSAGEASPGEAEGSAAAENPAEGTTEGEPASSFSEVSPEQDYEVKLTELRRVADGVAMVSYEASAFVDGEGGSEKTNFPMLSAINNWTEYRYRAAFGVWLTDPASERTASPLRVGSVDGTGKPWCACSPSAGKASRSDDLNPGEPREYYALVPLPGDGAVDVNITDLPTMEGVAVVG